MNVLENVNLNFRFTASREISDELHFLASYDFLQSTPDFGVLLAGNVQGEKASVMAHFNPLLRLGTFKVVLSTPVDRKSACQSLVPSRKSCQDNRGSNIFFLEHQATLRNPFKRTSMGCRIEVGSQINRFTRFLANHFNANAIKYLWRTPMHLGYGMYQRHQEFGMGAPDLRYSGLYVDLSHSFENFKPTIGLHKELGPVASLSAKYDMTEDEYALTCSVSGLGVTAKSRGAGAGPRKPSIQVHLQPLWLL